MEREATHQVEADRAMRSADTEGPPTAHGGEMVKVWDPFVRIFHWSLVILFATAYLTSETYEEVHQAAGYGVLGLVLARIVWGVIGTRHARFSSFVFGPTTVIGFLRDTVLLRAKRYIGHNPAGGAMVIALIFALLTTTTTGVMMTLDQFWGVKWIEKVHEAAANATLVLIAAHLVGVAVASLEHRENLVRSMLTGWKRRD